MKKSLRQMLLVSLSATMLAGIAAPAVFAQDDTTEEPTEQVEETTEEEEETTEEETTVEESDAETSEVQEGIDEALSIYEEEYPESVIEEIDVELDLEETIYTIIVRGFDVDNNDHELELEWADGEVTQQQFNEGWFNFGGGADTESADDIPSTEQGANTVLEIAEDEADSADDSVTEEAGGDVETTEEAVPTEDQLDEEQERLVLDVENLISIDEASNIALEEVGSGEINHWNLSADTGEWWNLFGEEENENPVWAINVVNMDEGTEGNQGNQGIMGLLGDNGLEMRIDAVTGEIINPEDIQEETTEEMEEADTTEETTEVETELEETVDEVTVEETEEAE